MGLADFFHGLFVLLTTCTYALPIYEGYQRRSPFYVILFVSLCALTFALHCEETGICDPLTPRLHARLQTVDLGLSYYLLNIMLLVVLEIRNEIPARIVTAVFTIGITARNVMDMKVNVIGSLVLGLILFGIDVVQHNRRFTSAWWRRLALIGGMAAIGAILFRLLKLLWAVHGIWHVYYVATCYLLLLAQRHKKMGAQLKGHGNGVSTKTSGHSTSATEGMGLSTPLKRKPGAIGDDGDAVV